MLPLLHVKKAGKGGHSYEAKGIDVMLAQVKTACYRSLALSTHPRAARSAAIHAAGCAATTIVSRRKRRQKPVLCTWAAKCG